jgi:hypothetical protein
MKKGAMAPESCIIAPSMNTRMKLLSPMSIALIFAPVLGNRNINVHFITFYVEKILKKLKLYNIGII